MALGNVGNPVPPVTTAKPGTASRMIEVAKSQVGVIEGNSGRRDVVRQRQNIIVHGVQANDGIVAILPANDIGSGQPAERAVNPGAATILGLIDGRIRHPCQRAARQQRGGRNGLGGNR